jgi:zinc protease
LAPLLDDLFGSLPARTEIPAKPSAPPQSASADLTRMELPQTVVLFGNTAPRLTWRQSLAFAIGNQILSGGFTGRLFSAIREKRGLVYSISAQRFEFAETSVFVTAFGAGSENVRAALDESRREIARFLDDGVSDEEVAAAKEAFLGSFFLGLDTNDKLVSQLLAMLRNDLPITYLDDYAAELEKITPADVMSAVRLVIRPEITNVVVVGNPLADFRLVPAAASATE